MTHSSEKQVQTESPLVNWNEFWETFHHGTAVVKGLHFHYVEGGQGSPVLLLPCCWPQTWYAWRYIMPQLVAAGHRVVVLDPRGVGNSDRPADGYDLGSLAADIHGVVERIGLLKDGPIAVAGHGIGTWLGYAYAADWRDDVRQLVVMNACVPGISSSHNDLDPLESNLQSWHFNFNQLDDLPELLIGGREKAFLTWLFRAKAMRPWSITAEAIDEYARHLSSPGAIRAISNYYRTIFSPEALVINRARAEKPLTIPVLALGAERGYGVHLVDAMRTVASNVVGEVVEGSGHYMLEEAPMKITEALLDFFSQQRPAA